MGCLIELYYTQSHIHVCVHVHCILCLCMRACVYACVHVHCIICIFMSPHNCQLCCAHVKPSPRKAQCKMKDVHRRPRVYKSCTPRNKWLLNSNQQLQRHTNKHHSQMYISCSTRLIFVPIPVDEVQCPIAVLHESLRHEEVIGAVQARLGKCLANTHVGFFNHCIALPVV